MLNAQGAKDIKFKVQYRDNFIHFLETVSWRHKKKHGAIEGGKEVSVHLDKHGVSKQIAHRFGP